MSEILTDGHPTIITFSGGSSGVTLVTLMKEHEVTPPGVAGGGENDVTSMRNNVYRTKAPKKLITLTPATMLVEYDAAVYDEIIAMLNDNQSMIVTYPDTSTLTFWGWIDDFAPNALVEGEQPTAVITIIPSNRNAAGTETAPDYEH